VVAGDIAVKGAVPVMQDGNIRNWIGTLGQMEALDPATVVPGHGELMKGADVAALRRSLERFHAGVKAAYDRGVAEGSVRMGLDLAEWERLERAYVIGRNINRVYLEVENESLDPPKEKR